MRVRKDLRLQVLAGVSVTLELLRLDSYLRKYSKYSTSNNPTPKVDKLLLI